MSMLLPPRMRVIVDNDFSGDPDDHFHLVHQLLSPSASVPFVIGSHLSPGDFLDGSTQQATNAARIAQHIVDLVGLRDQVPVLTGSEVGLRAAGEPIRSAAALAIVDEAMRTDTELPLYVAVGGGLTEVASALLIEPRIADRMTVVWIGGAEHPGTSEAPRGGGGIEYNLHIDVLAAQHVFGGSAVPIWQVPRDVYRQCLVSTTELDERVRPHGAVGRFLAESIDEVMLRLWHRGGHNLGETYALGDSPLVLLTALQSAFEPDSSSSRHVTMPTPTITDAGEYGPPSPFDRPMRVYREVDTRLLFEDLFVKLAAFAGREAARGANGSALEVSVR